MPLATRRGGLCTFSTFRALRSLQSLLQRNVRARYSSEATLHITRYRHGRDKRPYPEEGPSRSVSKHHDRHPRSPRAQSQGHDLPSQSGFRRVFLGESAPKAQDVPGSFVQLLHEQARGLRCSLLHPENLSAKAWGIASAEQLDEKMRFFKSQLQSSIELAESGKLKEHENPLFFRLRGAFVARNVAGLAAEMKIAFMDEIFQAEFADHHKTNQEKLADLRYPLEWFPATRAMQRTVHLHIGPTNSGKTYHALQRLEQVDSGIYAGPLRLLAHEVYSRLNAKGKPCALITGEERRIPEDFKHLMNSCTVEMVPLNCTVDVAVIDEIQMMGDTDRGWAWTQAFLGVKAKEVHLCGEVRTRELITDLCAAMGDKLVVHEYKRLSPLSVAKHSLNGDLNNLEKGDAIILFSRLGIHAMKQDVERITGKRAAVVYGSLPPETRAQQAALFNDPNNNYDYLVASDAVGMGLNLSIKRVIFETTSKNDGVSHRIIKPYEIKQIAGRAGRFKSAQEAINKDREAATTSVDPVALDAVKKARPTGGVVTTLEKFDLPIIRRGMATNVPPLASAGIYPPADILIRFATYFPPKTPFSYILLRLHNMASLSPHFHLCRLKDQVKIADAIQEFNMSNMDRLSFMSAPVSMRDAFIIPYLKELAKCVAEQKNGALLDLQLLNLELLDRRDIHDHEHGFKGYLRDAETLHRQLTLYLWLSYRFAGVFISQALAFHVKGLIEEKINECLSTVQLDESQRRQITYLRQRNIRQQMAEEKMKQRLTGEQDGSLVDGLTLPDGEAAAETSPRDDELIEIEGDEDESSSFDEVIDDGGPVEDEDELMESGDFLVEEPLDGQAIETLDVEGERPNSEDSPLSDGNMPTTPKDLSELAESKTGVSDVEAHAPEDNGIEEGARSKL